MKIFIIIAAGIMLSACATSINKTASPEPKEPLPLSLSNASAYFNEAKSLADKDNGKLWNQQLYGPILFVDYKNRKVITNQKDTKGLLVRKGDLFEGELPKSVPLANTPTEWAGVRWTMMIWQMIPRETLARTTMFTHEMFHLVQHKVKLDAQDKLNLHLDSEKGRVWLQLEWKALAEALKMKKGSPAQDRAIVDALAFREYRQKVFPNSSENERSLEISEGIPEYTGLTIAAPNSSAARSYAVKKLMKPDLTSSFVRSFAYTSGPAYGLLLDQRLPGWRANLDRKSNLGQLLSKTVKTKPISVNTRSENYDGVSIRLAEKNRAQKIEATKMKYRKLLIDGPTLTFPGKAMRMVFNPSTVVGLDGSNAVYPTFQANAPWGKLKVTKGALLPKNKTKVTVSAPTKTEGNRIEGKGWTLDLSQGWRVSKVAKSKNLIVNKIEE